MHCIMFLLTQLSHCPTIFCELLTGIEMTLDYKQDMIDFPYGFNKPSFGVVNLLFSEPEKNAFRQHVIITLYRNIHFYIKCIIKDSL